MKVFLLNSDKVHEVMGLQLSVPLRRGALKRRAGFCPFVQGSVETATLPSGDSSFPLEISRNPPGKLAISKHIQSFEYGV